MQALQRRRERVQLSAQFPVGVQRPLGGIRVVRAFAAGWHELNKFDKASKHALELTTHASAEAQVAAIADDIAYDNHDIDDGLRSGLITIEQLQEVEFFARLWRDARVQRIYGGANEIMKEIIARSL